MRLAAIQDEDDDPVTAITCARCGGNAHPFERDDGRVHAAGMGCIGCGGTGKMTAEQRARWARKVDSECQSGVRLRSGGG